jgi:hydroxymethylpyrimidine/phosphomethylpyrimidine kinase
MTLKATDTPAPGTSPIPRLLSIAGSDSGGGAGIAADLKAFAACGAHGMTAVTAITAQNTVGVSAVHTIPPEIIIAQVRAVLGDIGVDAVKIGMLGTVATIRAVATVLAELPPGTPVVIDPVMVAESGAELLEPGARDALIGQLLPLATVVTPNILEARALLGREAPARSDSGRDDPAADRDDAPGLAREIHGLGPAAVVVTGGHRDQATDVFYDGGQLVEIPGPRFPSTAAHGSGCTHSSVLAARLARGDEPLAAARMAKAMAAQAVRDGLEAIGHGAGPVRISSVT